MKTIFQSESGGPSPVKCKAIILADGAIEEFFFARCDTQHETHG